MVGLDDVKSAVSSNIVPIAVGAGVAVAGTGVAIAALSGGSNKKTSKRVRKKITHTRRGLKQDRARRSKQKWEVAYQRRKRKNHKSKNSKSRRGIHYTKNGQPYKIMANGRARFIKKGRKA